MSEFLNWLLDNPYIALILAISLSFLIFSVALILLIAFFQGREISLWQLKISGKPSRDVDLNINTTSVDTTLFDSIIIKKGTKLITASDNRITIEKKLWNGTNASVYLAENEHKGKVAVKIFWRKLVFNSPQFDFFVREIQIAEKLSHRNIVKTFDRGIFNQNPFIVMEYLGGGTLRDWLLTHERLPWKEIFSIATQIADAIDYAHSQGVIHRDIKPENILFESDPNGRVALGDFGVARILGAVEIYLTIALPTMKFVGTPLYLAPEIVEGKEITFASDIYSFGVVLYEMIAGTLPFKDYDSLYTLLKIKTSKDIPNIRRFREDISERFASILMSALDRDPHVRPKRAKDLIRELEKMI